MSMRDGSQQGGGGPPGASRNLYYFVIVGHNDQPIFEIEFPYVDPKEAKKRPQEPDMRHLSQFIAHAALGGVEAHPNSFDCNTVYASGSDVVDEQALQNQHMYLATIDKFNEWNVSAFVTASRMRFLMLHVQKNDNGIKQFFQELYESYIKLSMNPFHEHESPVRSPSFEQKAIFYGRKYLTL